MGEFIYKGRELWEMGMEGVKGVKVITDKEMLG